MSAIDDGRHELERWLNAQPRNFYDADRLFQALIERADLSHHEPRLRAFGAVAAGPLDEAVRENNLGPNLPWLDPWDSIGRHTAQLHHHPSYHEAGRHIYESGVMAVYKDIPNPSRLALGLFYLSSHVGEGGHNCPLACTAGAIRAIQALGTTAQKETWLPGLLRPQYGEHLAAAQFLTEVQGGSDVGSNAVEARPAPDGTWRIHGEKWFCSSADAGLFLMTARPTGAPEGTRGLGLFLVPRTVGAQPNGFRLRRLKDKLGTRTMVTAEIDFEGAFAEALGPVERGFKNTMELIIDTSRLYNAMGCAGLAHRTFLVASGYAGHRRAFGESVGSYPLVRETLAMILADAEASLAGTFWLAGMQERADRHQTSPDEIDFLRMGLNLNKVRTATLAHQAILRAIEVLGGNGTIETYSVLPRLLRDCVVFENWEGTHHTLRMQVMKDAAKLKLHKGFFTILEERLGTAALRKDRQAMDTCLQTGDTLLLRRVCDRLGTWLHQAALSPIDDPYIQARAQLSARMHLSGEIMIPSYAELIGRCG